MRKRRSSTRPVSVILSEGGLCPREAGKIHALATRALLHRVHSRQHKRHSFEGFTAKYEVDRLLYYETFGEVTNAIAREKQLKCWRRVKKIALIESMNPKWKDLSRGWYDKPVRQTFA